MSRTIIWVHDETQDIVCEGCAGCDPRPLTKTYNLMLDLICAGCGVTIPGRPMSELRREVRRR